MRKTDPALLWQVDISQPAFEAALRRLLSSPDLPLVCSSGVSRLPGLTSFLVGSLAPGRADSGANVVLTVGSTREELLSRFRRVLRHPAVDPPAAFLGLGTGAALGLLCGEVVADGAVSPLSYLRIVGPRLQITRLHAQGQPKHPDALARTLWSRTIGALGEETWLRLRHLRITLVGSGRNGSLMANALARAGVIDLTLCDPDVLEVHNCGESDIVTLADAAAKRSKADVIARHLSDLELPDARVKSFARSLVSNVGLNSVKRAEFIIMCVDNPSARLAGALLAQAYLKPLIDVGSGVLDGPPRMGADVRLLLPGRCFACVGSFPLRRAAAGAQLPNPPAGDWRRQRRGSLRSLNIVAAGLALRLLEEFLAGRIADCTWLNVEYERGLPNLRVISPPPLESSRCPVCALIGAGDAALEAIPSLLKQLAKGENEHL